MSRSLISLLTLSSLGCVVNAQPLDVRAPIAGFVHQKGLRSLRPIFGVAGSALLGPSLLNDVDSASISPGGKWALVTTEGRTRLLRGMSELAPMEAAGGNLIEAVDSVVWSRSGAFAVLHSSSTRQLQRVRFSARDAFPDSPISISWG